MVFDHVVKYNGEYYMTGEDVPIGAETNTTVSASVENEGQASKKRVGRPPKNKE